MSDRSGISVVFDVVSSGVVLLSMFCGGVMNGVNALFILPARFMSFRRNSHVPFWFNTLWGAANVLVFAFLFWGCKSDGDLWLQRLCLASGLFILLVHVSILIGRILVVLEDNSVMNGLLRDKYRVFCGHVIHTSGFTLLLSILFYFLFSLLVLWQIERLYPGLIAICDRAEEGARLVDWAILFLSRSVPLADRLLEMVAIHPHLEFAAGPGRFVAFLAYVLNGILIYYAVVLYGRQWYQLWALFAALSSECVGKECQADIQILQQRAARAPANTKRKILAFAIGHRSGVVRRRAISISLHARILSFPQTFVHNLHKESEVSNRLWGLSVAIRLLEDRELSRVFTRQHMDLLINKIGHQLRRNRGRKHPDNVRARLEELRTMARSMRMHTLPAI